MIKLNFLNTTTSMPFDRDLENYFYEKFNKNTFENFHRFGEVNDLLIFFVSKTEMDKILKLQEIYSEELFNPDLLGCYSSYDPSISREAIYICPEKIMEASLYFKLKSNRNEKLEILYKLFINHVILHELAHALMCDEHSIDYMMRYTRWQYMSNRIDEDKNISKMDDEIKHFLHHRRNLPDLYNKYSWYKTIEETLANIYAVSHRFTKDEKEIIWEFIAKEPTPYCYAPSWDKVSNKNLLVTMISWKNIKDAYCGLYDMVEEERFDNFGRFEVLEELENNIKKNQKIKKIDFFHIVINHFEKKYNEWKNGILTNQSKVSGLVSIINFITHHGKHLNVNFQEPQYYKDWIEFFKKYNTFAKSPLGVHLAFSRMIDFYFKKKDLITLDEVIGDAINNNEFRATGWSSASSLNEISILAHELEDKILEKKYIQMAIKEINSYPDHFKIRNVDKDLLDKLTERDKIIV